VTDQPRLISIDLTHLVEAALAHGDDDADRPH
jgi:hypothetical protein